MTIATLTVQAAAPETIDPVLERAEFFSEWDWKLEITSVIPQAAPREAATRY